MGIIGSYPSININNVQSIVITADSMQKSFSVDGYIIAVCAEYSSNNITPGAYGMIWIPGVGYYYGDVATSIVYTADTSLSYKTPSSSARYPIACTVNSNRKGGSIRWAATDASIRVFFIM